MKCGLEATWRDIDFVEMERFQQAKSLTQNILQKYAFNW